MTVIFIFLLLFLCILISLFLYQYWRLKNHKAFIGDYALEEENPFSVKNVEKARELFLDNTDRYGRKFVLFILRMVIKIRQKIKQATDLLVMKLSKIAFHHKEKKGSETSTSPNPFIQAVVEEKQKVQGE